MADGHVEVHETAFDRTRDASSEHAEYYVDEDKVILEGGQPRFMDSTRGTTRGQKLTWYSSDDRLLVNGVPQQPVKSVLHRKTMADQVSPPCAPLQTAEISKSYRGRKVVDNVSLWVKQGEVVGLLGPNGAGKTTSFYMIVGLISPDSGSVLVSNGDGSEDITNMPMYQRARRGISYLPQEASVFRKLTVEDNLMAILQTLRMSGRERRERMNRLIEQLGLETVRHNKGYALSGGERRRVEIARSLVIEPSFLLLDEPFSGIDPIQVLELQRIIFDLKNSGIGILVTDHNVRETLAVTDRAYIINNGKIFRAGTPDALGRDPEVRRVYLGENFNLEFETGRWKYVAES